MNNLKSMQYSAVQYSAVQCSAVQRSTVQCSTVQCSAFEVSGDCTVKRRSADGRESVCVYENERIRESMREISTLA